VVDHRLIAEIADRGLAGSLGASSTSASLRQVLRISPRELAPLFGRVAQAQAAGLISVEHARVIVRAVDKIPGALAAECEGPVESELVN
jgi:hypothetical protein